MPAMRASTSASQARGSMSLSLAVPISVNMKVARFSLAGPAIALSCIEAVDGALDVEKCIEAPKGLKRRRRIGAGEWPIVADVGPDAPGGRLALGGDWHRGVVAVNSCEKTAPSKPGIKHLDLLQVDPIVLSNMVGSMLSTEATTGGGWPSYYCRQNKAEREKDRKIEGDLMKSDVIRPAAVSGRAVGWGVVGRHPPSPSNLSFPTRSVQTRQLAKSWPVI